MNQQHIDLPDETPSPFRPARGWCSYPPAGMPPFWRRVTDPKPSSFTQVGVLTGALSAALAILALLLPACTPTGMAADLHAANKHGNPPEASASGVVSLLRAINRDREAHRLQPLTLSRKESRCSLQHSLHMSREQTLSHDQFPQDICVHHVWDGENVGFLPGALDASVIILHRTMMAEGSCPHRGCPGQEWEQHGHYLNLLNPAFRHIGIGIVVNGTAVWLTEDFTG
ncbi:MAG TPA: CAP domain-containing protein [Chloroflexota bacterium]